MENGVEKILSGNSIRTYELDDEDEIGKESNASYLYDFFNIINSIGTIDFKSTFLALKDNIQTKPFLYQKEFCVSILDKIEEEYNFKFPNTIPIDNQEDVNNIYKFLEFLEYDNIIFFSRLWAILGIDLKNIDIKEYCNKNINRILSEVEELTEILNLNWIISIFLRTYYKNDMEKFIVTNSEKNRMELLLIIQGG